MSAKQTQARVRQTAVSVTIEHGRNRMNTGGRTLGLEGSTATGLARGGPGGGPGAGTRRARQRPESKAPLWIM